MKEEKYKVFYFIALAFFVAGVYFISDHFWLAIVLIAAGTVFSSVAKKKKNKQ